MIVRGVRVPSEGNWLTGCLFSPDHDKIHPGVLLLGGFPGVQKHESLALQLVDRGMVCLLLHYRGTWGSTGQFSVPGLLADARAGLKLLKRYRHINAAQTAVLGVSVGGWVALRLAAEERVAAVAAVAPLIPRDDASEDASYLRTSVKMINSPGISAVWEEYKSAARLDFAEDYMARIHPAPVLLVHPLNDAIVERASTWRLWECAREPKDLLELEGVGHDLFEHRGEAIAQVSDWLALAVQDGGPLQPTVRPAAVQAARWTH